jgi:hypothetical protein
LFKGLTQFVLSELEERKQSTDAIASQMQNLHLDEEFLGRLLHTSKITENISNVRATQGGDSHLYYIFEGEVGVFDVDDGEMYQTLEAGEFFEMNTELSKQRRLKVLQS